MGSLGKREKLDLRSTKLISNLFQVHMKHSSSRGGRGGGHSASANHGHQAPSAQTAQSKPSGPTGGSVAVPEPSDRVINWVNEAQVPVGPPVRSAGQSGHGRGNRKKRLAANFPTE